MSRVRKAFGWVEGDKVFLSSYPRSDKAAANSYPNVRDALRDAQARKLTIEWDKPDEVDKR